jgi:hypothetical protein
VRLSVAAAFVVTLFATAALAADAVMTLTTWGTPDDTRFVVELFADGTVRVARERLPRTADGKLTTNTLERHISRAKRERLLALAAAATDFTAGCNAVRDGTNASIVIIRDAKETRRTCHNADVWPNGKHSRALMNAINAIVPGEMRVY